MCNYSDSVHEVYKMVRKVFSQNQFYKYGVHSILSLLEYWM